MKKYWKIAVILLATVSIAGLAAAQNTVDGFEDGDLLEWNESTGFGGDLTEFSAQQSQVKVGSYAAELAYDGNNNMITRPINAQSPDYASAWFYTTDANDAFHRMIVMDSNEDMLHNIMLATDLDPDSGSNANAVSVQSKYMLNNIVLAEDQIPENEWFKVEIEYREDTDDWRIEVIDSNNNSIDQRVVSNDGYVDGADSATRVEIGSTSGSSHTTYFDELQVGSGATTTFNPQAPSEGQTFGFQTVDFQGEVTAGEEVQSTDIKINFPDGTSQIIGGNSNTLQAGETRQINTQYTFDSSTDPQGEYNYTVNAVLSGGDVVSSEPVSFNINENGYDVDFTLTTPNDGTSFLKGDGIPFEATADLPDGMTIQAADVTVTGPEGGQPFAVTDSSVGQNSITLSGTYNTDQITLVGEYSWEMETIAESGTDFKTSQTRTFTISENFQATDSLFVNITEETNLYSIATDQNGFIPTQENFGSFTQRNDSYEVGAVEGQIGYGAAAIFNRTMRVGQGESMQIDYRGFTDNGDVTAGTFGVGLLDENKNQTIDSTELSAAGGLLDGPVDDYLQSTIQRVNSTHVWFNTTVTQGANTPASSEKLVALGENRNFRPYVWGYSGGTSSQPLVNIYSQNFTGGTISEETGAAPEVTFDLVSPEDNASFEVGNTVQFVASATVPEGESLDAADLSIFDPEGAKIEEFSQSGIDDNKVTLEGEYTIPSEFDAVDYGPEGNWTWNMQAFPTFEGQTSVNRTFNVTRTEESVYDTFFGAIGGQVGEINNALKQEFGDNGLLGISFLFSIIAGGIMVGWTKSTEVAAVTIVASLLFFWDVGWVADRYVFIIVLAMILAAAGLITRKTLGEA